MNEFLTSTEKTELNKIAVKLQSCNEVVARLIANYTELLNILTESVYKLTSEPNSDIIVSYLKDIENGTQEKIFNAFENTVSLNNEYSEITGIKDIGE